MKYLSGVLLDFIKINQKQQKKLQLHIFKDVVRDCPLFYFSKSRVYHYEVNSPACQYVFTFIASLESVA